MAPPRSYSTADLARRLGVSTPTVQRWVDQGYLKAWKTVGGHRRIDADSADRFVAQHGVPSGEAATAAENPRPSLLLVEDNPDDRDLICALIEQALPGAEVKLADNGFDALLSLGQAVPDILLTDLVMPHMDGIEMLRYLCNMPALRPGLIVVVTGQAPSRIARAGGLPEGIALLHKPLDAAALASILREFVGAARAAGVTPGP